VWPLSERASADWRPSNVVETKDLMSSASRDETTSEVSGTTRKPSSRDSRTSHGLNFSFQAVNFVRVFLKNWWSMEHWRSVEWVKWRRALPPICFDYSLPMLNSEPKSYPVAELLIFQYCSYCNRIGISVLNSSIFGQKPVNIYVDFCIDLIQTICILARCTR